MLRRLGHRHMNAEKESGARSAPAYRGLWALAVVTLILALTILVTPAYADRQNIEKIAVSDDADTVRITVTSSLPLSIHDSRMGNRLMVFDMYGYLNPQQQKRIAINSGGIKSVRCAWYKASPAIARLVVTTSAKQEYTIDAKDGGRTSIITVCKNGIKPVAAKAEVAAEPAVRPVTTMSVPKVSVRPVQIASVRPVGRLEAKAVEMEPAVDTSTPPVLVASADPMVLNAKVGAPVLDSGTGNISLDFVGSDIHDVLKALAVQSGINVVASPDVKGNVTVSLNKVSVEEALQLVTNLSGYRYAQIGQAYVVGTPQNISAINAGNSPEAEAQKLTEVIILKYADPAAVSKLLEKQFSAVQASTSGDEEKKGAKTPSALVLSGMADDVRAAKSMVDAIENSMEASAVTAVVELYEVKYASIAELPDLVMGSVPGIKVAVGPNLGFNLRCPGAVTVNQNDSTAEGPQEQKSEPKMLILQGSQDEVDRAKAFLDQVDAPRAQIVIEAKVIDLTETGAKDLGIEWGGEFGTLTTFSLGENRTEADDALNLGNFSRSPLDFVGKLKAIVASGNGKVLANPNVAALDGKPASIFIGDEVKYVTRVDETENGITVTTETARVGVQLHSVSTVSSDGYITMNLHPEVSVITDWKELPRIELALPEISRRFVDSTIRVKDGETIVIGGLIKDEEIRSMSGIPLLKDLPIIGSLFRYEQKTKAHSEVMMFITPRILTSTTE